MSARVSVCVGARARVSVRVGARARVSVRVGARARVSVRVGARARVRAVGSTRTPEQCNPSGRVELRGCEVVTLP